MFKIEASNIQKYTPCYITRWSIMWLFVSNSPHYLSIWDVVVTGHLQCRILEQRSTLNWKKCQYTKISVRGGGQPPIPKFWNLRELFFGPFWLFIIYISENSIARPFFCHDPKMILNNQLYMGKVTIISWKTIMMETLHKLLKGRCVDINSATEAACRADGLTYF